MGQQFQNRKRWVSWLKKGLFLCPAIIGLWLYWLLPYFPEVTEKIFSGFFFRLISIPLGGMIACLPFSLTEVAAVLAAPILLTFIGVFIYGLIKRIRKNAPTPPLAYAGKWGRRAGWIFSSAFLLYMLLHGVNFYRQPVSALMRLNTDTKSPAYLQQVCIDLAKKASAERELVAEDEQGHMMLSQSTMDTLQMANEGYQALDSQYPFLFGGVWRAKPVQLSHWWSYTGITGMYFPIWAEANVNIDIPHSSIPSTAAHELAHTRGFAREDECNFFAYLTSIHNDSADFRYSGYKLAYIYCSNALYDYDVEMWKETRAYCSEGMERDFAQQNTYWQQFEGKVQEVSSSINNSFISSQGDKDGVLSYNRVVQLIVGYYEAEGLLNP